MNVITKMILKDSRGDAKGVAKIYAKGGKNYVEVNSPCAYDDVIVTAADGERSAASPQTALDGPVDGVCLTAQGQALAWSGKKPSLAPVAERTKAQSAGVVSQEEEVAIAPDPTGADTSAEKVSESSAEEKDVIAAQPFAEDNVDEDTAAEEQFSDRQNDIAAEDSAQAASGESDELPQSTVDSAGEVEASASEGEFYRLVMPKLKELFEGREHVAQLEALFPDSQWVRVEDEGIAAYVVGIVGSPVQFICYGIPDEDGSAPPSEKTECRQWLPMPTGGGYWMMYQSAVDGKTLSAV